jgi:uncharacterized membrane protein HdeD (DUF308 family)
MAPVEDSNRSNQAPLLEVNQGLQPPDWPDAVVGTLPTIQVLLIGVLIFFVCYLSSKLLQFSVEALWICAGVALFSYAFLRLCGARNSSDSTRLEQALSSYLNTLQRSVYSVLGISPGDRFV